MATVERCRQAEKAQSRASRARQVGLSSIDFSYENSVMALYDCLEEVLGALVDDIPATIRLKGALLLEKIFINEQPNFSEIRHFDLHAWQAIIDHSQQATGGLNVAVLDGLFNQMYSKWPDRPYQDAQ